MWFHARDIVPVEQPVQLLGVECNQLVKALARPVEPGFLQTFLPQAEATVFPVQNLDTIPAPVAEHEERAALGIAPLPQSLGDAIKVMEKSELVADTLGEHVFDFFLRNKRAEWQEYRKQVTAYELDRYLPVL